MDQHPARDSLQYTFLLRRDHFHESQVLLAGKLGLGGLVEQWRRDNFKEQLGHFFRGFTIHRPVHPDHTAECRNRIALQRLFVSFRQSLAGCGAAGIGMLDNRANRFGEFLREIPGGLNIHNIVVGKFLPLQLASIGHARA